MGLNGVFQAAANVSRPKSKSQLKATKQKIQNMFDVESLVMKIGYEKYMNWKPIATMHIEQYIFKIVDFWAKFKKNIERTDFCRQPFRMYQEMQNRLVLK